MNRIHKNGYIRFRNLSSRGTACTKIWYPSITGWLINIVYVQSWWGYPHQKSMPVITVPDQKGTFI
jgi:hypothetical protein